MKILVTMYGINSPGGIINHNENLISGLKLQGHDVNFIELVWRTEVKAKTTKNTIFNYYDKVKKGYRSGVVNNSFYFGIE